MVNIQVIVTWVGIARGIAGVGYPAYTTHKADQAALTAERQQDAQRARHEQAEHDRLWQTLDKYQRNLDLLNENLPTQERRIAKLMFAQMQAQQEAASTQQFDKSMPVIAQHGRRVIGLYPEAKVAADAPAEEKPQ